jgi:hypothetical protein
MRRAVSIVTLLFVVGGIAGSSSAAFADVDARLPHSFCGAIKKMGTDAFRPEASGSAGMSFDDVLRALRRVSKQAPDQLDSSFDALLGFYDILESRPDDSQAIIDQGRKVEKAGRKITRYLKRTCNIDLD